MLVGVLIITIILQVCTMSSQLVQPTLLGKSYSKTTLGSPLLVT